MPALQLSPARIKRYVKETLFGLSQLSHSYRLVFRSPAGAKVLEDLQPFCRASVGGKPPWGSTPEETARYIGRYEVYHRIMQNLQLSPEELYNTWGGKYPIVKAESEDE